MTMLKRQKGEAMMLVMMAVMIVVLIWNGHMGPMGMQGQNAVQQESRQGSAAPPQVPPPPAQGE
jgi:hypothetical protein